jgi:Escherichia/Staphylococcus phage prohead protease
MPRQKETRIFKGVAIRLAGDDKAPKLEGHIAVFNELSEDLGGFRELIAPGAFAETIKRDDIRALWNHNSDLVLGRLSADTLELEEDDIGLAFRNTPPDTSWFKDKIVSLKRKDVTGASFGFYTDEDNWASVEGKTVRTLLKVTLVEVSPGVTFPAYPQTDVALNSMRAWEARTQAGQAAVNLVQMEMRERRLHLGRLAL